MIRVPYIPDSTLRYCTPGLLKIRILRRSLSVRYGCHSCNLGRIRGLRRGQIITAGQGGQAPTRAMQE